MFYVGCSVLFYDLWFYISHRILHTPTFYKYHKIHHAIVEPTFSDTYTSHWSEGPFQGLGVFVPYLAFSNCSVSELCAAIFLVNARGVLRHDKRGSFLVGDHHLIHHKNQRFNYGERWLDYVFNTLYSPLC